MVGGGAAGFFAAITAAEANPDLKIVIIEKQRNPLQKVKVSGGGRCNVTHFCFEPEELIKNYPRGSIELLKPFKRFGPKQVINWFQSKGVEIKKEADGRMFPISDSSQTIIDCFETQRKRYNIELKTLNAVDDFNFVGNLWEIKLRSGELLYCENLMLATGSDKSMWDKLSQLGFEIVLPVPSLFTFKIQDQHLIELAGTSFLDIKASNGKISSIGPGLITHWGLSGPAILKLSAFAAREFNERQYEFNLMIDWLPSMSKDLVLQTFKTLQANDPKKKISANALFGFSLRFWKYICQKASIGEFQNWSESGKKQWARLSNTIKECEYEVNGKSTFKEEFVTAGGIELSQVDFDSFSSCRHKGLYFAGEVLNIDAVTGGFNFQAAWTGAWHVSNSVAKVS